MEALEALDRDGRSTPYPSRSTPRKYPTSVVEGRIMKLETAVKLWRNRGVVFVSHKLVLTMIDSKISNAIT
jgi:hypothetical protein